MEQIADNTKNIIPMGLIAKYITIIFSIPFYIFVSVLPLVIFIHIYTPFTFLIYRIHNDLNPDYKIKLTETIEFRGNSHSEPIEDDTFSKWIKKTFPKFYSDYDSNIFSLFGFFYGLYVLTSYATSILIGTLIIKLTLSFLK